RSRPANLFGDQRRNSKGWDITDPVTVAEMDEGRGRYKTHQWQGGPGMAVPGSSDHVVEVRNPANPEDLVGQITYAAEADVRAALEAAQDGFRQWSGVPAERRAERIARWATCMKTMFTNSS